MDTVLISRMMIGITLGFHIIFATLGVGIPFMILLAEWFGMIRKDPQYSLLARRWARGYSITVAVGVVTGTIIGLQLSLFFPGFMRIAGHVISLPLFLETFAFFFEAIFLGIYLYTWDRFKKPVTHLLLLFPVVIGSGLSAFFITTVNAFMNTPQGFTIRNGVILEIDPLKSMFNPATPTETTHVIASAYMTCAAVLAAISAFYILRGKRIDYYRKALRLTAGTTFVLTLATSIIGDLSGKFLANQQPEKLAAAEWLFHSESPADLLIGGVLDPVTQQVKYGIKIPGLLSFLAHDDFHSKVIGLNEFPRDLWPPLFVHYLFDLMVSVGIFSAAVTAFFVCIRYLISRLEWNRWLLRALLINGPLSMLAIEFGWTYAEIGRQPWILRGYMKVAEAATTSPQAGSMLVVFCALYLVLGILSSYILMRMASSNPVENEMEKRGVKWNAI
ncbi:cytochrome ubiquinol oxidase subunit I [Fodinisporobacter ferrooxydans]|uniref:Cytochrome ubiquinol oxidase subunit I n=1 Tax=Fodinisporobacter ferrooxydans TaxID=2901836 RepID=A0ABY4CK80_9BACL|nr:cytochrome ubiquinol oxidase subunit I [Alicyclobacillaceae bacterium MYW30-H2]